MPKTAKLDLSPVRELARITEQLKLMTDDAREHQLQLAEIRRDLATTLEEVRAALGEADRSARDS